MKATLLSCVWSILSAGVALIGWSWMAGGRMSAIETRVDGHDAAIVEIKAAAAKRDEVQQRIAESLASIDKRLAELQAEQRILHGGRAR